MNRDPGFSHPVSAAIGAELIVILFIFLLAALVVNGCGAILM
jgi:hypothetical protein